MQKKIIGVLLVVLALTACTHFTYSEQRGPASVPGVPLLKDFKPQPNLKTVCAMTLNSQDELEAFKAGLPADRFQFVELVEPANENWFSQACAAPIRCDILVVSGHYGGTFDGTNGKLTLADLEKSSCSATCPNILNTPKEVFLFGCNTLSGKQKDFRTQEQYRQALIDHGFDNEQAEMVAAFRYSPLGSTNYARMSQVFQNVPRIYGFDSSAPLGKNVKHMLENYFDKKGPGYSRYLSEQISSEPNEFLLSKLKVTNVIQASGLKREFNPVCYLASDKVTFDAKLSWIESTLSSESALENIPYVNDYLKSLAGRPGAPTAEEQIVVARLSSLGEAKAKLLDILDKKLDGFIFVQVQLANFSKRLGWIGEEEYRALITRKVFSPRAEFSTIAMNTVCGLDIHVELTPPDIVESWWQDPNFVRVLGCMQVENPEIQSRLIALYHDSTDREWRANALHSISQLGEGNGRATEFLLDIFLDGQPTERLWAAHVLTRRPRKSIEAWQKIGDVLSSHPDIWLRELAINIFLNAKDQRHPRQVRALIAASLLSGLDTTTATAQFTLKPPNADLRINDSKDQLSRYRSRFLGQAQAFFRAFGVTPPERQRLQRMILSGPARSSGLWAAAQWFSTNPIQQQSFVSQLIAIVQSPASETERKRAAVLALTQSQDRPGVAQATMEALTKDPSAKVREAAALVAQKAIAHEPRWQDTYYTALAKETDPATKAALLDGLTFADPKDPRALRALMDDLFQNSRNLLMPEMRLQRLNPQGLTAWNQMTSVIQNGSDPWIGSALLRTLTKAGAKDEARRKLYLRVLSTNPSGMMKSNAAYALDSLGIRDHEALSVLIDALNSPIPADFDPCRAITLALAKLGGDNPQVVAALQELANSSNKNRRRDAQEALNLIHH